MSIDMNDKAALVVGGTSGIGLATVRRLLEAGCEVRATGVSPAEVESCQDDSGLAAVRSSVTWEPRASQPYAICTGTPGSTAHTSTV